jgi:hypothetical protein
MKLRFSGEDLQRQGRRCMIQWYSKRLTLNLLWMSWGTWGPKAETPCKEGEFSMKEAKTEEEPPGPGRPSYHRENAPPIPRFSQRWQLSHCLNAANNFAWASCLISEKVVDLPAPGLFRTNVSPYFVHFVHPENLAFPIESQIVLTLHKTIHAETCSCTSIPWHKPEGNNGR